MTEDLITLAEAGVMTREPPARLFSRITAHELAGKRVGGKWMVSRKAIEAMVSQRDKAVEALASA